MANITIQDLETNEELDKVSLGGLVGGHRCYPPRRICKKILIGYWKKVRVLRKKTVYYWKTYKVKAYKTALICYWK